MSSRKRVADAWHRLRPGRHGGDPDHSEVYEASRSSRNKDFLARSACILKSKSQRLVPDPTSRTLAHETAVLGLESLKESTSVLPPVQSLAGGLLKLLNTCETMTQNATDRQLLYERINTIKESLVRAWGNTSSTLDPPSTSQAHFEALHAFDTSVQCIAYDAETLSKQFKSRWRRFVLARKHKLQIAGLLSRLTVADDDFRRYLEFDRSRQTVDISDKITQIANGQTAQVTRNIEECTTLQTEIGDLRCSLNHIPITVGLIGLFA